MRNIIPLKLTLTYLFIREEEERWESSKKGDKLVGY